MPESSLPSYAKTDNTRKNNINLVFLPGLHGTAELFDNLVSRIQRLEINLEVSFQTTLISYPTDLKQSYAKLFKWLCSDLSLDKTTGQQTVIIAESFSTPLALKLANKFPKAIHAVIIGGGFCASPANPGFALLPIRPLFLIAPPRTAVRHFLTGTNSSSELVTKVRSAVKHIPAKTLSQRTRSILTLEEEQTPTIINTPVLLLQAEHDALIPWEVQNQLEQHLPHATSHWIDSPHLIFQAHPQSCAQLIVKFLGSLKLIS
ncbi:MAG: alpha/beta fold hydrolase [Akkermansiaceae bacterium]